MMSGIAVILTALVACFAVVTPVSAAVVQTSISSSRTFTRNNTVQPQSLSETTSVHTEDDVHWGGIEELQVPITKSPAQIKAEQEAARKKAEEEAARKKAAEERAAALLKQQANKQEEQPSSDNNDNVGTFLDGQPWDAPKQVAQVMVTLGGNVLGGSTRGVCNLNCLSLDTLAMLVPGHTQQNNLVMT